MIKDMKNHGIIRFSIGMMTMTTIANTEKETVEEIVMIITMKAISSQ
jgi:hypothetical protein